MTTPARAIENLIRHGLKKYFEIAKPGSDVEPCVFFAAGGHVRIWQIDQDLLHIQAYKEKVMEIVRFIAKGSATVNAVGLVMPGWKKDETNTIKLGEIVIGSVHVPEHMETQMVFELARDSHDRPVKTTEYTHRYEDNDDLTDKGGTFGDFYGEHPPKEELHRELLVEALEAVLKQKIPYGEIPSIAEEGSHGNKKPFIKYRLFNLGTLVIFQVLEQEGIERGDGVLVRQSDDCPLHVLSQMAPEIKADRVCIRGGDKRMDEQAGFLQCKTPDEATKFMEKITKSLVYCLSHLSGKTEDSQSYRDIELGNRLFEVGDTSPA